MVTGVGEDPGHPPVVGQHIGLEPADAALGSDRGEMFQQHRGEAAPLVCVVDDEGDFGLVRSSQPVVAANREHFVTEDGDQRGLLVVVDVGIPLDLAVRQRRMRSEVPVADALRRQPAMQRDEPLGVLGLNRPQMHRPAISEDDIRLPMSRILDVHGPRPRGVRRRAPGFRRRGCQEALTISASLSSPAIGLRGCIRRRRRAAVTCLLPARPRQTPPGGRRSGRRTTTVGAWPSPDRGRRRSDGRHLPIEPAVVDAPSPTSQSAL